MSTPETGSSWTYFTSKTKTGGGLYVYYDHKDQRSKLQLDEMVPD